LNRAVLVHSIALSQSPAIPPGPVTLPRKGLCGFGRPRGPIIRRLTKLAADSTHTELFVAPDGRDTNPGTKAEPFGTLERARDQIRALKREGRLPAGGAVVSLREGVYYFDGTFGLAEEDSGTEAAPIVYRAFPDEEVRLNGGKEITGFRPVTDPEILARLDESARDHVLVADLTAQGITSIVHECPEGFPIKAEKMMSFHFNGEQMTLARWPNDNFTLTGEMEDAEDHIVYDGDRPQRWAKEDDVWVYGYWYTNWRDHYQQALSIDAEHHRIALRKPHPGSGYHSRRRFFALNILAELDTPGEWYVDKKPGKLYFWPPGSVDEGTAVVSVMQDPLVLLDNASHILLEGLTFECSRGHAVVIRGGGESGVAGCEVCNVNSDAIVIRGGRSNGARSCDIHHVGAGGITLDAGDRKTLEPGECFAHNNHIRRYAVLAHTYRPAVQLSGVGNEVKHNLIHDAPHGAVQVSGNEHLVEFNEIHHVVLETDDAGAVYMGRDVTERGNTFRYNYIHHLGGFAGIDWRETTEDDSAQCPTDTSSDGFHSSHAGELNAFYFDDIASGSIVFGNVLHRAGRGTRIAGGSDCLVENNIYVECNPSVEITGQGLTWASDYFDGRSSTITDRMKAVNYDQPPYSERYPELVTFLENNPGRPKNNRIIRNISFESRWCKIYWGISREDHDVHFQDNLVDVDPGFVDMENENFQLKDDSPAYALGFQRIPMEEIGLVNDTYRRVPG